MYKKILFGAVMCGFASIHPVLEANLDAYANYYSSEDQIGISLGDAVAFESQHEVKKFSISDDRKTMTCLDHGFYRITFDAVGIRANITSPHLGQPLQVDGDNRWGLALKVNGTIVEGSSVNVDSNGINTAFISGQVVIELQKRDEIQLVNNTHSSSQPRDISLESGYGDISASIAFVRLDD